LSFDSESIQIIGANSVGKSSLIEVFQLIIFEYFKDINQNLEHFLKEIYNSYIIFEMTDFFILVLRKNQNEMVYFKIYSKFEEVFFIHEFEKHNETFFKIFNFETVFNKFKNQNIRLVELKYENFLTTFFNFLEGSEKNIIDSFLKLYKDLIVENEISANILKNSFLNITKLNSKVLDFNRNKQALELKKRISEINNIQKAVLIFEEFNKISNEFNSLNDEILELHTLFIQKYEEEIFKIDSEINNFKDKFETTQNRAKKERKEQRIILKKIGELSALLSENNQKLFDLNKKIDELGNTLYPKKDYINREKEIIEELARLNLLLSSNKKAQDIDSETQNYEIKINMISQQIDNFDMLLINKLGENTKHKKLILATFTEEICFSNINEIDSELLLELRKNIKKLEFETLTISQKMRFKNIKLPTKTSIKKEFERLKKDYSDFSNLRDNNSNNNLIIENTNKLKEELSNIHRVLELFNHKSELLKEKNYLEDKIEFLQIELSKHILEEKKIDDFLSISDNTLIDSQTEINNLIDKRKKFEQARKEIEFLFSDKFNKKINISISYLTKKYNLNLREIFLKLKQESINFKEQEKQKNQLLQQISEILNIKNSENSNIYNQISQEIANITQKEQEIFHILENMAEDIIPDIQSFLRNFEILEHFITEINQKLQESEFTLVKNSEILISYAKNIISELNKIKDIQHNSINISHGNNSNQIENLLYLKKHIENSTRYDLSNLFDIKIKLNNRYISVNKVTELRTFKIPFYIILINYLLEKKNNYRLILPIDSSESFDFMTLNNIIKFSKNSDFIPVFTSIYPQDNISKYYFLFEDGDSQELVLDERMATNVT
jgi:hypothetical protein